jgi:hypothetical protein
VRVKSEENVERWDGLTCDVQTLLKVTKAKVCAIMDVARSFFATTSGMRMHERRSWGMKARDSACKDEVEGSADVRYSSVL